MVGDLVRRHTVLAPRRRCRCWRQRRPGSPHPAVHDRSGFPRAPPQIAATKPKRSIKRSDSRAAPGGRVSNTAGGNAAANAPNEGLGRLPDRTVPALQAQVGDPLGAHSWRSRSSPLCKRPDAWPSLVSSRARASPRRAGAWIQLIDAPAIRESSSRRPPRATAGQPGWRRCCWWPQRCEGPRVARLRRRHGEPPHRTGPRRCLEMAGPGSGGASFIRARLYVRLAR